MSLRRDPPAWSLSAGLHALLLIAMAMLPTGRAPRGVQPPLTVLWHGHLAAADLATRESTVFVRLTEEEWLGLLLATVEDPAQHPGACAGRN